MTELSDVLNTGNRAELSARAIARAARERGHSINHDTAARYLRGDHGRPDEATLVAFADVLRIPLAKLRIAANLPAEQTAPYSPPPEASRLTRRQRRAVDEIIRAMLEPSRSVITELPAARTTSRRAARHGELESPGD